MEHITSNDWTKAPLVQLLDSIIDYRGISVPKAESGIPLITARNIRFGFLNFSEQEFISYDAYDQWMTRGSLENGDVLFTTEAPLGNACMYPDTGRYAIGQRTIALRTNKSKLIGKYLLYFILSEHGQRIISLRSTGTTAKGIKSSEIKKLLIDYPSIIEQQKIVRIISTWDAAIDCVQKLLENSRQQKKALMQQLLIGKRRLPGFSQIWKWIDAERIFAPTSKRQNGEEELLAVTQDQGVIPRSRLDRRVVMPEGSTEGYKLVIPGNFIISLRSFQGGLEYSTYRGLVSPAYTVITPIVDIDDDYYMHYFKSYDFIGHLAIAVIGIRDGKQISYTDFSFLRIPYPPIQEQKKIASVLCLADKLIEKYTLQLRNLQQQKKSLMQQLLTGKRRVKLDPAEPTDK